MSGFTGRTAIITGGASGIGRALAASLVERGARVVIADRNEDLARQTAAALGGGEKIEALPVEVSDPDAVRRLVEETADRHGRLDYLFNKRGVVVFGDTLDMTLEDWNRTIDVNLRGGVHGIVAAYPLMVRQGSGHGWIAFLRPKNAPRRVGSSPRRITESVRMVVADR